MPEQKFRVESDLLGELQVPAEAYYGVQTQRALNNYKISNTRMCDYPEYVIAIAYVKMAAATANAELGVLDKDIANAHLQVDIEVGEDSLQNAARVLVNYAGEKKVLSASENSVVFDSLLTTATKTLGVTFYYEMEACTIDEINASTNTDVTVKLYANVVE